MKHFLFISLISMTALTLLMGFSRKALAEGNGMSGGGTGTIYQGTFIFFDLLENIQNMTLSQNIKFISTDEQMNALKFEVMTIDHQPGFKKLQEMSKTNNDLRQVYVSALNEVVWVKTNAELKPLYDVYPIPHDEKDKSKLVQVAIHLNGLVTVNDLLFSLLGEVYQMAAIVHETVRVMAYNRNILISTQEVQEITEALMNGRKHPLFTEMTKNPDFNFLNKNQLDQVSHKIFELGRIRETVTDSEARSKINQEIMKLSREWRYLDDQRASWPDYKEAAASKRLNVLYIYSLIKIREYVSGRGTMVTIPKVTY